MAKLDAIDLAIATYMQNNPNHSLDKIAHAVNRTTTPVWKRIRKMEYLGVISRTVTVDRSQFPQELLAAQSKLPKLRGATRVAAIADNLSIGLSFPPRTA